MAARDLERDLADVRRAAFELRHSDPAEAVRILRRLVRAGGEIEALAHGALGEILLDDFEDVDAAQHHFRRLLVLAPGLPAGELGLARALSRHGDTRGSLAAYGRAHDGLLKTLTAAQAGDLDEEEAALEETLLSALEIEVEARELARDADASGAAGLRVPPALLAWVESSRLLDDEDGESDDWLRYAELLAISAALHGDVAAGLAAADRIATLAPLDEGARLQTKSLAHEAAGELAEAAKLAQLALETQTAPTVPAQLRAADLLEATENHAGSRTVLERLRAELTGPEARARADAGEPIDEALAAVDDRLKGQPAPKLVTLGTGFLRRPR